MSVFVPHQQLTGRQHTGNTVLPDEAVTEILLEVVDLTVDLLHCQVAILRDLGHEPPDWDTEALQAPAVEPLILDLLHALLAGYIHDADCAGRRRLDPGQVKAILTASGWLPTMFMPTADIATALQHAIDDVSLPELHGSTPGRWVGAFSWTLAAHLSTTPDPDDLLRGVRQELTRPSFEGHGNS